MTEIVIPLPVAALVLGVVIGLVMSRCWYWLSEPRVTYGRFPAPKFPPKGAPPKGP